MINSELSPVRLLVVDEEKCIGCRACSNLWAEISSALTFSDKGPQRTIKFPRTFEEFEARIAESLAEACPTGAISVALADERQKEESFTLTFQLVRCRRCRTPFATVEEVKYVIDRLPEDLRSQSSAVSWMELCPSCRRSAEREAAARDLIVVRSGSRR
ncbi:MAG TPA: ferredoxin [Methanothrix sp.]|nr:ferredoxin [Methanothrix sp.]